MAEKSDPKPGSSEPEFVISRVLAAPRELVFKVWTDPGHLARWWGPSAFTIPVCDVDVRAGGAFRLVMRSPDGVDYPLTGFYREIVEPERLVMALDATEHPAEWHDLMKPGRSPDEVNPAGIMVQTATFEALGRKTRLTIRTRFESQAIRDAALRMGMTEGWSSSLDRLEEALSGPADREILLSRDFQAPRELVWEAWTDPRHVVAWWGPRGFTTTVEEMDVRTGGVWRLVMHGPDGIDYPSRSVFTEVVRPERIRFRQEGGRAGDRVIQFESTWTFEASGPGRTRVTIRMLFPTAEDRDRVVRDYGAVKGGLQTLARLAEHLASGR
jgi:uncharacterized protein YndB with AHSA1/START domain